MYGGPYYRRRWYSRYVEWRPPVDVIGHRYLGPCRCGGGPHAFYEDEEGRIVHVSELYPVQREKLEAEIHQLKEEKLQLEKG